MMSILNKEQESLLRQAIETMIDDKVELEFDYDEESTTVNFDKGGCCVINCYGNNVAATYKQVLSVFV